MIFYIYYFVKTTYNESRYSGAEKHQNKIMRIYIKLISEFYNAPASSWTGAAYADSFAVKNLANF